MGPRLVIVGSSLWDNFSLDSAAPTNPTGSPTTSAGSTSGRSSNSKSAVGAFPTTQTAPVPTSCAAVRNPAAERVMFKSSESSRARASET